MPIVIDNTTSGEYGEGDAIELFGEDGQPTLEAEVLVGFVEELDLDAILDDEDVKEFIELEDGYFQVDEEKKIKEDEDGNLVPCAAGKEAEGELLVVETLDGEIAHMFIDEDDVAEMFGYYVENLPEETLEDKARKAVFAEMFEDPEDDEDLDERKGPFKKGAFRKIHKGGGAALVNRMLGAMMHKVSIKRAKKPGKGYKKGDYTKAGGYAPGTSGGVKKWRAYKSKKAAELAKQEKKTRKSKKALKKVGLKAAPKKGAKKAGAKSLAKKKKGKKKKIGASEEGGAANLNEEQDTTAPRARSLPKTGAALAGAIMESKAFHDKKPDAGKKD